MDPLFFEKQLWQKGYSAIAGIDEVGRGPLAGPVYACAVIFHRSYFQAGVRDSKKVSEKKRIILSNLLTGHALSWAIGQASVAEIDEMNIRQATFLAMKRAVKGLQIPADYLLIDGEEIPGVSLPMTALIKGDARSFTIGAASIIAKVKRDTYMLHLDRVYPSYGFKTNKGYGTAEHIRALKLHGVTPYHRNTFLKKIYRGD